MRSHRITNKWHEQLRSHTLLGRKRNCENEAAAWGNTAHRGMGQLHAQGHLGRCHVLGDSARTQAQ